MDLIKFFAVVSFVVTDPSPNAWQNLYVFTKEHDSKAQCVSYVKQNKTILFEKAAENYDFQKIPHSIYCITMEQLREVIEDDINGSKTQDI